MDLPQAAAQKGMEDGGLGAHCDVLRSPVRGAHSHVIICGQHVIPAQDRRPRDLQHGHEGSCSTDDSDQCPGALPESGPRSTSEDDYGRMTVPAGESPTPLSVISCMGTTVQTHLASSCSCLAVPQMQVFQQWHCQGGLHYI